MRYLALCALCYACLTVLSPAHAAISAESAARLHTELTPVGAIRAANRAGTIPKWEGGLAQTPNDKPPSTVQAYPDPFAGDKVQDTVTAKNWQRYQTVLTAGQQALLQQYPDYQIQVYPTHRSAAFPESFYQATKQLATQASVNNDGALNAPALNGIPFPIPRTAQEVLWNYQLRYQGRWLTRRQFQAIPSTADFLTLTGVEQWRFASVLNSSNDSLLWQYRQRLDAPKFLADYQRWWQASNTVGSAPLSNWLQLPTDNRPRRVAVPAGDAWESFSDGLQTVDQWPAFSAVWALYDWQLVGRQELFVPYNAYALQTVPLADLLNNKQHLNTAAARYERHRVWVVEAKLAEGKQHRYNRQVLYFDEDSWYLLAADIYNAEGKLWRVFEAHTAAFYDVPTLGSVLETLHDVQQQRYLVRGLAREPFLCDYHSTISENTLQPE